MSLTPEMMTAMLAAGLSAEQIVAVVNANLAAEKVAAEAKAEKRRADTAERVRKHRDARRNASNALQHVTPVTAPAAPLDVPPLPPAPPSPPYNPPTTPELQIPSGSAPLSPIARLNDWPADFENQFWTAYPRHTDRKKAMAALAKVHRQDKTPFAAIIEGCQRLRSSTSETHFLPHATTWLNGERWNDELPAGPIRHGPVGRPEKATAITRFADRLEARRERNQPQDQDRSQRHDRGTYIDHEGDGGPDREVYQPAGGQAGRFSPEAVVRLAGSRWR